MQPLASPAPDTGSLSPGLHPRRRRYRLPVPAAPERRQGVPIAATLAPVLVSVVLWMVTRSVFTLVFAFLGPVVALGGLIDGRIRARRGLRRSVEDAVVELERLGRRARLDLAEERDRLDAVAALGRDPVGSARSWRSPGSELPVLLGRGAVPSGVVLERDHDLVVPPRVEDAYRALTAELDAIDDSAVLLDGRRGIGVVGAPLLARSACRSIVIQLCALLSPEDTAVRGPRSEEWLGRLPHRVILEGERLVRFITSGRPDVVVAWAEDPSRLPPECTAVVTVGARGPSVVALTDADGEAARIELSVDLIAAPQAAQIASVLSDRAERQGVLPAGTQIPDAVRLADLTAPETTGGPGETGTLTAPIGADDVGPVAVDLVRDGPHAVVGGTTGSGKSELLITWVVSLARANPPDRVSFLLVDFKGGASFEPLRALPHVVGVLSDLDVATARRATASLRAEILRRERLLAEHGVRAIEDLPPGSLARLVIVIDEFAALVGEQPDLHELMGDLAARGRSLGLHLVLCTQRPAGVIRDAVLANVTLRIGLRMIARADSEALLGSPDAARLPVEPRGRALLSRDGSVSGLQVAVCDPDDIAAAAAAWPGATTPAKPWSEPPPPIVRARELPPVDGRPAFCLVDDPDRQTVAPLGWDPEREGSVLVVGGSRAGTTTTLAALARAGRTATAWLPEHPGDAWAVIIHAAEAPPPPTGAPSRLLVIDDLDLLLDRLGEEHRLEAIQLLARLARETAARRLVIAAAVKRLPAGAGPLLGALGRRLLLGLPSRDEHVLAGGSGADWAPDRRPGSGRWRDREIQVAIPDEFPTPASIAVPRYSFRAAAPTPIATSRPRELAAILERHGVLVRTPEDPPDAATATIGTDGPRPVAVIGDPDEWQRSWTQLTRLRRNSDLLLDRCSSSEFRSLSRSRHLPPPLDPTRQEAWLVGPEGVRRVRIGGLS